MGAEPAKRSSANTTLMVGALKMDIGLFGTQAKPGAEQHFDTAGPNGGRLTFEERGKAAPVEDAGGESEVKADPLGDELAAATPTVKATSEAVEGLGAGTVAGEYRRVLVEEGSGVEVPPEKVRRGVRLDDGRFVDLTDQVEAITERTKLDRIEVVATIESSTIRRERVVGSYYVGAQEAGDAVKLRLLFEALKVRREVAVVKYTTRSRQQLGVLVPHVKSGTLVLLSLVFSEDFREPPARALAVAAAEVEQRHVTAMSSILSAMREPVAVLDSLRDDAIALREELRTRAEAGEMDIAVVEPMEPETDSDDLVELLRASAVAARERKVAGRV